MNSLLWSMNSHRWGPRWCLQITFWQNNRPKQNSILFKTSEQTSNRFDEDISSFYCRFNCVIPTPFPFKIQLNWCILRRAHTAGSRDTSGSSVDPSALKISTFLSETSDKHVQHIFNRALTIYDHGKQLKAPSCLTIICKVFHTPFIPNRPFYDIWWQEVSSDLCVNNPPNCCGESCPDLEISAVEMSGISQI